MTRSNYSLIVMSLAWFGLGICYHAGLFVVVGVVLVYVALDKRFK